MRQLKQRLRTSRKANNRWTGLSYASSYTELRSKGIRAYAYIYLTQKLISVFTESSRKAIKTHFLGDREVQRNRNLQSFSNPSHDSVRKKAVYSWFSKSSGSYPNLSQSYILYILCFRQFGRLSMQRNASRTEHCICLACFKHIIYIFLAIEWTRWAEKYLFTQNTSKCYIKYL